MSLQQQCKVVLTEDSYLLEYDTVSLDQCFQTSQERVPFVFMGWIWKLYDRPKRREKLTDVRQRHIPE